MLGASRLGSADESVSSRPEDDDAIRLHETQAGLFRDRYREYQDDPYRTAFGYGRKKIAEVVDGILPRVTTGRRVLDAGCGTGFLLRRLEAAGYRCVGIDMAQGMLRLCREGGAQSAVFFGDVGALPFASESFDLVVSIEVVRYLSDPASALQEFYRVLKGGGLCVVTAAPRFASHGYALFNWWSRRGRGGNGRGARQYFDTVGSLRRKLEAVGFRPVTVGARFLGPFRVLEKLWPGALGPMLRTWESIDGRVSDLPGIRQFANHLVGTGVKPGRPGHP